LVLDPTCGSGTFLLAFTRRAFDVCSGKIYPSDLAARLARKLHGFDVDPLAILMARAQIYMQMMEAAGRSDIAEEANLLWCDTLKLASFLKRKSAPSLFTYMGLDEFSDLRPPIIEVRGDLERVMDIVSHRRFDVIIGNPPWGMRSKIVRELRRLGVRETDEYLKRMVPVDEWREEFFSRGNQNLLVPFLYAFDELLRPGGIMAVLLDARFIAAKWGEPAIELLNEKYNVVRVLDISSHSKFLAVSYPCVLLALKGGR